MTSNFDRFDFDDGIERLSESDRQRLEALSAYLDGEATSAEGNAANADLAGDEAARQTYRQWQTLRAALATAPTPPSTRSPEEIANAVMARSGNRCKQFFVWGSAVAAALSLAVLSTLAGQSPISQMARSPESEATISQSASPDPHPSPAAKRSIVSRALFVE